jgi:hypothetical protein
MNSNKYRADRMPGKEHIPVYPKGFIALRIVQLIISVIIIGLMGYTIALGAFSGNCLMIFTVRWPFIHSCTTRSHWLTCTPRPWRE